MIQSFLGIFFALGKQIKLYEQHHLQNKRSNRPSEKYRYRPTLSNFTKSRPPKTDDAVFKTGQKSAE